MARFLIPALIIELLVFAAVLTLDDDLWG